MRWRLIIAVGLACAASVAIVFWVLDTAAAFVAYQQLENHVLNPVVMSRTVNINPLLVLLAILVGTSIGDWLGGFFGSFVAALISIPLAGALQVVARELWQTTAWRNRPTISRPAPNFRPARIRARMS